MHCLGWCHIVLTPGHGMIQLRLVRLSVRLLITSQAPGLRWLSLSGQTPVSSQRIHLAEVPVPTTTRWLVCGCVFVVFFQKTMVFVDIFSVKVYVLFLMFAKAEYWTPRVSMLNLKVVLVTTEHIRRIQ